MQPDSSPGSTREQQTDLVRPGEQVDRSWFGSAARTETRQEPVGAVTLKRL